VPSIGKFSRFLTER